MVFACHYGVLGLTVIAAIGVLGKSSRRLASSCSNTMAPPLRQSATTCYSQQPVPAGCVLQDVTAAADAFQVHDHSRSTENTAPHQVGWPEVMTPVADTVCLINRKA